MQTCEISGATVLVCVASTLFPGICRFKENHYHAAVWIDHHEVRIFHFHVTDVDESSSIQSIPPAISITKPTRLAVGVPLKITPSFKT